MINEYYQRMIMQVKDAFAREGVVELKSFLQESDFEIIVQMATNIALKKEVNPMSHSYAHARIVVGDKISGFIKAITGRKPRRWEVWQFAWKDYTAIHDEHLEKNGFDAIIEIADWDEKVGGDIIYVDGSGDYTRIAPEKNKLIIVERKEGTHRFVKYVNHYANDRKRVFIITRF